MKTATLAALSTLFEYPSSDHDVAAAAFPTFAAYWRSAPFSARCQAYVRTFDVRKDASLYLTYPVLGDTRDRGVALARLKALYRAAGFEAAGNELPDFLPLVLDFCARARDDQARYVLTEVRAGIEVLHRALSADGSPYASLTAALRSVAPKANRSHARAAQTFAERGAPLERVGR